MPTSNKSEVNMNEKFAQLFQLVSGLPAMHAAINGITHDFEMLSTVVTQLQSAITSINDNPNDFLIKLNDNAKVVNDNANDFLIKKLLCNLGENIGSHIDYRIAKKILTDLGENVEAQIDYRTFDKFGKKVILKFNCTDPANDFFSRRAFDPGK